MSGRQWGQHSENCAIMGTIVTWYYVKLAGKAYITHKNYLVTMVHIICELWNFLANHDSTKWLTAVHKISKKLRKRKMFFGIWTVRIYVVFSRAKVRVCLVEGVGGANESAMPVQYQCNANAMIRPWLNSGKAWFNDG